MILSARTMCKGEGRGLFYACFVWVGGILALETLSALTLFHAHVQTVSLIILTLTLFVLAWRRPEVAAAVLVTEYVIGSKGALLRAFGDGVGHGGVPLRIAWFAAFFFGWLMWAIKHKTYREWRSYLRGRSVYLLLGLVLVYAFVRGSLLHNTFVFDDANAWGVWLLLLPALDLVYYKRQELEHVLLPALVAAFGWLCVKTLLLFYVFSHLTNPEWLQLMYLWVRRTGVGEITRALSGVNVWRVFFQSHIYVLPAVIVGFWYGASCKLTRWMWVGWVMAIATLIVSLSRSLFLGVAVSLFASLVLFFFSLAAAQSGSVRRGRLPSFRDAWGMMPAIGKLLLALFASLFLVAGLFYAPPRSSGSLMNLIASRIDAGDAASMSRWELGRKLWRGIGLHPVLGSGFGATITYKSSDPRVVASTGGVYTTYAFEWGWLEHWFKFGLVGIPLMLWIVLRLMQKTWSSSYAFWIRGALVSSCVGLIVTHVFTPYLNHPLGIIWLIMLEAMITCFPTRAVSSS